MKYYRLLEEAIRSRSAVRFSYDGSDGSTGERVGSPHALYAHPTTRKISCDINQHRGASASGNVQPLKPFNLEKLISLEVAEGEPFQRYDRYDPDAPRYVNAVAKID